MLATASRRVLMLSLTLVPCLGLSPSSAQAAAWYRGDLHNHSVHSDGDGTVREIITVAEQRGLDFLAITDHDGSMSGIISTWTDPDYNSTRTELLYGAEWTTGQGHANLWSDQPYDYSPLWEANRANDVTRAIDAAHEQGVLFSINHPEAYGCCPWKYDSLENVDAIEVWNSTFRFPSFNDLAVDNLWDGLLLTGFAPTAVGGSDTHYWHGVALDYKAAGNPTTWVYADDPTPESILRGISAGNVTLSYSPDAPRLELPGRSWQRWHLRRHHGREHARSAHHQISGSAGEPRRKHTQLRQSLPKGAPLEGDQRLPRALAALRGGQRPPQRSGGCGGSALGDHQGWQSARFRAARLCHRQL